jgi:hypothetical protein
LRGNDMLVKILAALARPKPSPASGDRKRAGPGLSSRSRKPNGSSATCPRQPGRAVRQIAAASRRRHEGGGGPCGQTFLSTTLVLIVPAGGAADVAAA